MQIWLSTMLMVLAIPCTLGPILLAYGKIPPRQVESPTTMEFGMVIAVGGYLTMLGYKRRKHFRKRLNEIA
jgi:FtsH-binding integral membrane protein